MGTTREFKRCYHHGILTKYPDKPSHDQIQICAVHIACDKQLYDENTNMPSIHFTILDNPIPHNVLISLPPHITDRLINGDINIIENARPYFPPIPPHFQCIWIFKTEPTMSITFIVKMGENSCVQSLYQLIDPLTNITLCQNYTFNSE